MLIRCWGARGSIPVSGNEYSKYGGSTTCLEIRSKNDDVIIVDAGSGIRKLGATLLKEGKKDINILFTHVHWDHLLGFPFFKPIYFKGTKIKMYGCPFARESVRQMIAESMSAPYFPIGFNDVAADISGHEICNEPFSIGSVMIHPIVLSHPNRGLGYRFEEDGKSFVFLTDNELSFKHEGGLDYKDYLEFSAGADLLVHDAEYSEDEYKITRMWGHSTYKDALKLALEAGVMSFGLFHHNQERADEALDEIVEGCKRVVREKDSFLDCFAMYEGQEINL
ncbi:MAG: MBL fold metallo-hydrolase [bacterium]|nr:MBL fold metallo-hydrolase [bacterium]